LGCIQPVRGLAKTAEVGDPDESLELFEIEIQLYPPASGNTGAPGAAGNAAVVIPRYDKNIVHMFEIWLPGRRRYHDRQR
jgi:hypothetical protein